MPRPTIKLERSTRADSRGIRIRIKWSDRPLLTLALHHWRVWRYPSKRQPLGFTATVRLGRGAGYRGRTVFVAVNARGGGHEYSHRSAPFRVGFTRNANGVPYSFR